MATYDSIIFDLDGTIWDSRHSVAIARNNVVKKLALPLPAFTAEDVQKSMGLPMEKVYEMSFSCVSKEEYLEVRKHLDSEISSVVRSKGAALYAGVEETLAFLCGHFRLFIVSNCSVRYLATYLEWSGHKKFFKDSICNGENGFAKADNIKVIMDRNALNRPVYIGDTAGDHKAAIEAGIGYIHVNFGFGEPAARCSRISHFSELKSLAV